MSAKRIADDGLGQTIGLCLYMTILSKEAKIAREQKKF